jgi:tape measure domain-containing protein
MTVESKIVFRSDSSEVKRSVADIKAAKAAMVSLQAGTDASPKIALERARGERQIAVERAKYEGKFGLAHQRAVAGVVERRQKSEIALDKQREALAARAAAAGLRGAKAGSDARRQALRDLASPAGGSEFASSSANDNGDSLSITDMKSALDVALQVGRVVYAAGAAVIQAQAFKEDVTRGFAILAKSEAEGARVLRMSSEAADFLGQGRADVAGQFLDLLTKGFNPAKVDEITKRLADLSTVDPRANLEGLSRAIGQIAGKGRLQGDELLQLAEAGLETKSVYEALSKSLGKSIPDIIKLQEKGKISSDVATDAILEAIASQTGGKGAGVAAREKSLADLSGIIKRLSAIPENLLFDVEVGPGVDQLKGKLREVVEFFDASSATGKETRQILGDTINAFAEGLFGIDTKGGGVTDTLKAILEVVKASKGDIKSFAAGIASIGSAIAWFAGGAAKIAAFRAEFEGLSKVDTSGGIFGLFKGILVGIPSLIAQTISGAIQTLTGFSLWDAGANLINSLAGGIKGAGQSVIDAVTSTVGGAISWAKKLLGIASPSKVFMQIGDFSGKGFAAGLGANDNAIARAGSDMAIAGTGGASTAGLGARSSRVSTTTIAPVFSPVYSVTALGPKEVEELRALQADERSKFEAMLRDSLTREANAA